MNITNAISIRSGQRNSNVGNKERIISALAGGYLLYSSMRGRASVTKGALSVFLLYRAVTGHCPAYKALNYNTVDKPENINIRTVITVNKPRSEVFAFWRKLENLPLFMKHLKSVEQIDDNSSMWKAKIPGWPVTLSWKAQILKEEKDELLSWQSLPDSTVFNAGKVEFRDAGNNETEVHAVITYKAPLGKAGEEIARLLNPAFENMVQEDLRNFRRYIETGEVPTIEGQPYGSKHKKSMLSSLVG
jgi:uncharacterized membrane protein